MSKTVIGIDMGGTNFRIGAVNEKFQIQHCKIINSHIIATASSPLEKLYEIIDSFIEEHHILDVEAVSIGVPSSVLNDKQTVVCTTNLRDKNDKAIFQNENIAKYLMTKLNIPVFVNNDTKNILMYDIYDNHLDSNDTIVGIYIGTGVGAAVVSNGESIDGAYGAALDLGHIPFFKGKEKCSCGKHGCCECYASGWKLQKIREEYFPDTEMKKLFVKYGRDEHLREFVESCAHVFAVMATIFNPKAIVAGGGVIEMEGFPKDYFEEKVNENTGLDVMTYGFDYIYSKQLSEKGIVGAAIFANQRLKMDITTRKWA